MEKIKINIYTLLLVLSLLFQSLSIFFGKIAALSINEFSFKNIIFNKYYWFSILSLFFQAIVWQLALKKYPLTIAYFFMSNIFVVILLLSYFYFKENISWNNILGAIIIIIGVLFLNSKDMIKIN